MSAWTEDEGFNDSHTPTFTEVGAAVTLVLGALCIVAARLVAKRWLW